MDGPTLVALANALAVALPVASPQDRKLLIAWAEQNLPSMEDLQAELARRGLPAYQPPDQVH